MPTAKDKGGSTSQRYRPASEFDDATLAQKREYWRTKKREQRARLSGQRDSPGKQLLQVNAPAVVKSTLPRPFAAFSSPLQSNNELCKGTRTERQKEKWLQTMQLNKVPASCSRGPGGGGGGVSSPPARAAQLSNTTSSVPPATAAGITNGSSASASPQPSVSMQGAAVPGWQRRAQPAVRIQPKPLAGAVSTGLILVSMKAEGRAATTPQYGTKSALMASQRDKGVSNPQSSLESEEERAARRREHWRIKKREQRAKVAAQTAKARERAQGAGGALPRHTAQRARLMGAAIFPSQSLLRGVVQRQCHTGNKTPFTSTKRENDNLQSRAATLVTVNLQVDQTKVQNAHGKRTAQTAMAAEVSVKRPGELQRKLPSPGLGCNASRGLIRCKTPRQRLMETQKSYFNQRNLRCKSPLIASVFGSRNIPRIDPGDTAEQIIAKRREYWRIKKREQRAKLTLEVKVRLKEKDSLMRRMKRYQKILEDMRRARALGQASGGSHVSDAIGGFIKEDGTVSISIPQKAEEELQAPPAPPCPAQVKVSLPLLTQSAHKSSRLVSVRPRTQAESTSVSTSRSSIGQLILTHPQSPQRSASDSSGPSDRGGCVMKMAVSSGAPPASSRVLTEEERMAKKREYWRIKKREQRAAFHRRRAQRQVGGALQAREERSIQTENGCSVLPLQRRIKQEGESVPQSDLTPQAEDAVCPDPTTSPPPAPQPAPQPAPHPAPHPAPQPAPQTVSPELAQSSDSQATTLRAVASMKKLLEESLSTVSECQTEEPHIKVEVVEGDSELEMKPDVAQTSSGQEEAADLARHIKSQRLDEAGSQCSPTSDSSQTLPPPVTSSQAPPPPTCEHASQTASSFIVSPAVVPDGPPTARGTGEQDRSSPQPQQPQTQQGDHSYLPSAQRPTELSGLSSLQRKREYWKLMKRQQRARLRARRGGGQAASGRLSHKTNQGVKAPVRASLRLETPSAPLATGSGVPAVLLISSTDRDAEQSLRVRLPVTSVSCPPSGEEDRQSAERSHPGAPSETQQRSPSYHTAPKWTSSDGSDVDVAPCLPTLTPPDNPLSSIKLHPIEPMCPAPELTLSPIRIPCAQLHSPLHATTHTSSKPSTSTMVPPKPIPGEAEEDFLRRKREYWRIKKKEQRARKAIREKGSNSRMVSNSWRPILPAQNLHTQDSGQWESSPEHSDHFMSTSVDPEPEPFPYQNYTTPLEDESELLFSEYEHGGSGGGGGGVSDPEEPVSDDVWRNCYLMDYEPLNQLLVCMVCGELQYSHSVEGARAHIDEAHPHTLSMEAAERRHILDAWDEQVSRRERFFTSQLQQHGGALAEPHNRDEIN